MVFAKKKWGHVHVAYTSKCRFNHSGIITVENENVLEIRARSSSK